MTQETKPKKSRKKVVEDAKLVEVDPVPVQSMEIDVFVLLQPITTITTKLENGDTMDITLNGTDAVFPVFLDMGKLSSFVQTNKTPNPQFIKIRIQNA